MTPIFFATSEELRDWFAANHETATELWVGFYRKGTGRPSITWPEAVDEALCVGWIDGVRRRVDDERYANRFTPRRRGSNWSAVNVARVADLTAQDRMQPAGLRAFAARVKEGGYSYEQREDAELGEEFEARFRAEPAAWAFFQAQPPSYRKTASWWVLSAKKEETRLRRLATLIEDSAQGRRIKQFARPNSAP